MQIKIDKRDRAELFRLRLQTAIKEVGTTQSALARDADVDRSTISQLLQDDGARLPNAHLVASCAAALGVSADWLLGLSERPERAADLVASAMSMTEAPRALIDEHIFAWHQEAAGYKIRHVPAGLPDMLKIHDMMRWEYTPSLGRTTEQAIGASEDRLNWMRGARSDFEIALPLHEMSEFATGTGYYLGLPQKVRLAQIDRMIELCEQLYPTLRLYLFDARKRFSAPVTIFGPLLAAVYLGSNYLVFRDTERVQAITRHFDGLLRQAEVPANDIADHLRDLRQSAVTSV